MEFSGQFDIDTVTVDEVWLALSDPVMVKQCLPGCAFLVQVGEDDADFEALREETADDEDPPTLPEADPDDVAARSFEEGRTYAALVEVGVGSVKPSFETLVTIEERELPRMRATGEGSARNSSFEMDSWMTLTETDDGVRIDWEAETDVFGKVAQLGQRVINPVANQVVSRFFSKLESELSDVAEDEGSGLRGRIRSAIGRDSS